MPTNFGWVWPGRLAAMGRPWPDDVPHLVESGLKAVLTLTEEPPIAELATAGLTVFHEPVPDFTPPEPEALSRCVAFVETMIRAQAPVVVHCFAGYGRTGTVVAAVIVASGVPPDAAIREVRRMRPGSIETLEQEDAIRAFAARIARASRPGRPGRDERKP